MLLLRAPGVGPARYRRLLDRFETPQAVFTASRSMLDGLGLPVAALDFITQPDTDRIAADLAWLAQADNHLITWQDAQYPARLREISQAPPMLYVHGDPSLLSLPQLAMVGSRNPSPSGARTATEFSQYLTQAGLVISSGLAQGIDTAAHQGALLAEGPTIAVMGTGLDRVYPASNRKMAHQIAQYGGALVSEFAIGTPALAEHFPRRNRIISGLAMGTLVVEAAPKSGSLITAQLAVEQGREVFAIPGSIHNPLARGCHQLIRQGAKLVETGQDVLEELAPYLQAALQSADALPSSTQHVTASKPASESTTNPAASTAPKLADLDQQYQDLLAQIGADPVAVDTLVNRCGLTADVVSSMLLILELHGYVSAQPGGLYFRIGTEDN